MYTPAHFKAPSQKAIDEVVKGNLFAALVTSAKQIDATHVPLEMQGSAAAGKGFLHGHLARGNPQAEALQSTGEALAIFTAPHAYVSPRWYAVPGVPTWNYIAVHCYGRARIETDGASAQARLADMVRHYEGAKWSIKDLPLDQRERLLAGIVSFSIEITRVDAKFKLSQNKPLADQINVCRRLEEEGEAPLAKAMRHYGNVRV